MIHFLFRPLSAPQTVNGINVDELVLDDRLTDQEIDAFLDSFYEPFYGEDGNLRVAVDEIQSTFAGIESMDLLLRMYDRLRVMTQRLRAEDAMAFEGGYDFNENQHDDPNWETD